MSDDSSSLSLPDYSHAWKGLSGNGYALIQDWDLGVSDDFREQFHQRYFNDDMLRHDDGDWPKDRKRSRDVIHYKWSDSGLELSEHETITITDRPALRGHASTSVLKSSGTRRPGSWLRNSCTSFHESAASEKELSESIFSAPTPMS